eukprot:138797-Chlamydomonas_euryale.AAC.1
MAAAAQADGLRDGAACADARSTGGKGGFSGGRFARQRSLCWRTQHGRESSAGQAEARAWLTKCGSSPPPLNVASAMLVTHSLLSSSCCREGGGGRLRCEGWAGVGCGLAGQVGGLQLEGSRAAGGSRGNNVVKRLP